MATTEILAFNTRTGEVEEINISAGGGGGSGGGDMFTEVYDPDGNGFVDRAAVADSVLWANVDGPPDFATTDDLSDAISAAVATYDSTDNGIVDKSETLVLKNYADLTTAQSQMVIGEVATLEVPDEAASYRTVTGNTTMLVTDRDITMVASAARTITLLAPSQFVLGEGYHFSKVGAGNLTVNGTVYDNGGEVTSLTVLDGESLVLRRYQKTDNSAGLRIVTQG